ncbi:Cardiotrophin-like cytokine factor 1 [Oryzias melastigma]|uniref:Cardiotrophin-like cytokine factor 1 n=1 Tax=Oryzias melastigma TaxID=30732 RepID=A0A834F6M4_ORYME|nr:Cardiotrophin-like cytokine factor 1 [Oryzias melastigma]
MKMKCFKGVNHLLALLLAAAAAWSVDAFHSLASERKSIESTYELTKYLEYQLKEIKDVYLTYLGPPFNEKDFSPPRPNSTALSQASAATQLEQWHGLENQARLAQNQRAYSILLAAVRELARSTLCPSLKTSLLHFCMGLDGLLGSISALMNTTLGYSSSSHSTNGGNIGAELQSLQKGAGANQPAPLMSHSLYRSRAGSRPESGQRSNPRRSGTKGIKREREDGVRMDLLEKRRGKEERRAEESITGGRSGRLREKGRGRREKREEPGSKAAGEEEAEEQTGEVEKWGRRRRLLSVDKEEEEQESHPLFKVEVSYQESGGTTNQQKGKNQFSFNLNSHHLDTVREEDGFIFERNKGLLLEDKRKTDTGVFSSFHHQQHRPPRSIFSPTLQPPLSTLSLLYQYGIDEGHTLLPQTVPLSLQRGTSLLSPPLSPLFPSSSTSASSSLLSVQPTMNDFARKVEGFWILRELQSWLWRSAKDFNRLKRRLRG